MYPIKKHTLLLLLLFSGIAFSDPLFDGRAQTALVGNPKFLPVEQAYQLDVISDGDEIRLKWTLAEGYYLYKHQFAVLGMDLNRLEITPNFDRPGSVVYDDFFEQELRVFYNQLEMTMAPPTSGEFIIESQACADAGLCYPPRRQQVRFFSKSGLFDVSDFVAVPVARQPKLSQEPQNFGVILLFALLGGLILNLMPCVFPVLSIKVLSLAAHHQNAAQKIAHGSLYAVGVVVSLVAVASVMLLLRSAGQAVGWGFQLQSPLVVAMLIYLFVLMGLSFSGVFNLGARLMNFGQGSAQGVSLKSSFMTGVLATVVASPCSAPFMGTALGFALTQSVAVSLLVFATLGIGMALPVFVLCAWPRLASVMPRPGAWMETLKQVLAFPLYLSAVWLVWVLGRQTGSDTVAAVLAGLVLLVFALWLAQAQTHRVVSMLLMVVAIIGAVAIPLETYKNELDDSAKAWEGFSQSRLSQLLSEDAAVFVNVTADWCITCLANERVVLGSSDIQSAFKKQGVVYLKADWTTQNAEITKFLNQHQRTGVPLYLYYSRGKENPEILSQILTKNEIYKAIGRK